jgi:hypothetical protein
MAERTELKLVSCSNCQNFIIGNGQGLGECKIMNNYLAEKHDPIQNKLFFAKLGNKNFWAGTEKRNDRFCPEFAEAATQFSNGD